MIGETCHAKPEGSRLPRLDGPRERTCCRYSNPMQGAGVSGILDVFRGRGLQQVDHIELPRPIDLKVTVNVIVGLAVLVWS